MTTKRDKRQVINRDIGNVKREVKVLEKEFNELNECKQCISTEVKNELEIIEQVEDLILNYKKQLNELRKDKEKM